MKCWMRIVSIVNDDVSKNLDRVGKAHAHYRPPTGKAEHDSPATDASPWTHGERDKRILVPFTQEPFWFKSKRIFPISCCEALCKQLKPIC